MVCVHTFPRAGRWEGTFSLGKDRGGGGRGEDTYMEPSLGEGHTSWSPMLGVFGCADDDGLLFCVFGVADSEPDGTRHKVINT